jgi:hypothetical protein
MSSRCAGDAFANMQNQGISSTAGADATFAEAPKSFEVLTKAMSSAVFVRESLSRSPPFQPPLTVPVHRNLDTPPYRAETHRRAHRRADRRHRRSHRAHRAADRPHAALPHVAGDRGSNRRGGRAGGGGSVIEKEFEFRVETQMQSSLTIP